MTKIIIQTISYECDTCHKTFSSEAECRECEMRHSIETSITRLHYDDMEHAENPMKAVKVPIWPVR